MLLLNNYEHSTSTISIMKNFDTMTGGFEKMGSRRGEKKGKQENRKNSSHKNTNTIGDYEEYFNTRYGNKLYK